MNSNLFKKNRQKLLNLMDNNSVMVINSWEKEENIYSERYNVNRNYFYITGVFEYGNIVVLSKIDNITSEIIFINPYDDFKAKWVGAPLSKDEINNISGIEDVRYKESFKSDLEDLINRCSIIYLDVLESKDSAKSQDEAFKDDILSRYNIEYKNASDLFKKARTVKSIEEIEEMKKAIEITNKGLEAILSNIGPMYEYQLESYFDQAIKYHGATGYSFPTIAASGRNATCLHYGANNQMAKAGDLILFDLGASLNMYCADISRTYPISGKFTERQKELYNIVLGAQELVYNCAKPGLTTRDLNNIVVKYYQEKLKEIGLINEDKEVFKYYYHAVSHHMGLDCHDLCEYNELKPGCVISNEPGLYIKEEGIGIRIEDDLLITEDGCEWLSPQIIKTVEDIEEFIEKNRK